MASTSYGGGFAAAPATQSMITQTKTLLNAQLKHILSVEGLRVSGVKSDLQMRVISHIQRLANQGDQDGLQRLRPLIYNHGPHTGFSDASSALSPFLTYSPAGPASPQYHPHIPQYGQRPPMPQNAYSRSLTFKDSPFYEIKRRLTDVIECKARENTRDTARTNIDMPHDVADLLNTKDSHYRVMVFCAVDSPYSTPTDISFPHQVELKCNANEVKANTRGIKNKPGSTRPADITSFVKKKTPGSSNVLEMVYALTSKAKPALQKYFLVVNLVRKVPVEDLVQSLVYGKCITKDRVIKEMTSKAQDAEIEATSSVLSLKCPLSATRIATPCRSISCSHNQCFDAASYLMLQEQAPLWTCPICNRSAPFQNLLIDLYVDNILKSTSSSTESVTVEPNGSWHQQKYNETPRKSYNNPTPDDDDDDLIEIADGRISNLRADGRSSLLGATPPMSSREPSTVPSTSRSNKRPASAVIDLTISDDDEDEDPPHKMIKHRPSVSSNLNGSGSIDLYRPPAAMTYDFTFPHDTYGSDDYENGPPL